ncbi:hypothetical protein C8Q74DRAFT_917017 [Fomes fomentarius]|nr:hypothetical protein C8Q74DRAFT_917017 [Fomes fomentarius]
MSAQQPLGSWNISGGDIDINIQCPPDTNVLDAVRIYLPFVIVGESTHGLCHSNSGSSHPSMTIVTLLTVTGSLMGVSWSIRHLADAIRFCRTPSTIKEVDVESADTDNQQDIPKDKSLETRWKRVKDMLSQCRGWIVWLVIATLQCVIGLVPSFVDTGGSPPVDVDLPVQVNLPMPAPAHLA